MKRHMKLITAVLRYVEEKGNGVELDQPQFVDFTEAQIAYHITLCSQAGYLQVATSSGRPPVHKLRELTWAGHEFLDLDRH